MSSASAFSSPLWSFRAALTSEATRSPCTSRLRPGSSFYFTTAIFSYILGLVLTVFVMHTFKAAQPALLYLVPLGVATPIFWSVLRGEIFKLFKYEHAPLPGPLTPNRRRHAASATTPIPHAHAWRCASGTMMRPRAPSPRRSSSRHNSKQGCWCILSCAPVWWPDAAVVPACSLAGMVGASGDPAHKYTCCPVPSYSMQPTRPERRADDAGL